MNKQNKILLYGLGVVIVIFLIYSFVTNFGEPSKPSELSAVIYKPSPDFQMIETSFAPINNLKKEASVILLQYLENHPENKKFALPYTNENEPAYFLINLDNRTIEHRYTSEGGAKVKAVWRNKVMERLQHATKTSSFKPPNTTPPEISNLYH